MEKIGVFNIQKKCLSELARYSPCKVFAAYEGRVVGSEVRSSDEDELSTEVCDVGLVCLPYGSVIWDRPTGSEVSVDLGASCFGVLVTATSGKGPGTVSGALTEPPG